MHKSFSRLRAEEGTDSGNIFELEVAGGGKSLDVRFEGQGRVESYPEAADFRKREVKKEDMADRHSGILDSRERIPLSKGHIELILDNYDTNITLSFVKFQAKPCNHNRENCHECPDGTWPKEDNSNCTPKSMEFLSYEQDVMAAVFSSMSGLFIIITVLVSGIFIFFSDTPIVKANNRNISFILLLSLTLSLLCVFLFIGRPDDTTCMLRQISIGVTFTVAVSSILAKSLMVSIIDVDMDTYPGKIIIQCNEGSVVAYYFMLGYLGFLAAVSFVLAFMVRTLPDIYNEAKYITFSMLLFCSVWICAIPAYLSSKGKNMVMVEIFSILASEIGILGCIFFPKCYNIVMRKYIP
ncbi:unnamed protein product [Ranitomeya imitator]|uniref:G-protein coupled receptors family 3 profile domain-containing protein n=1 Tax=Ranitomeya imitator TaxID=111125 RepID=A0ABN9M286_9NEOB|nr:unnamed protein product [Ranitomeya imitator]